MKYGTGCIKSKLDGTEFVFKSRQMSMPTEYSYIGVMPPILNQGATSKCVCYALTAYLDWKKNTLDGRHKGGQFDIDKLYSIREDKNAAGMQIKEALKYLRHTGLNGMKINAYAKVGSALALQQALILNGPCPIGTMVYDEYANTTFWRGRTSEGGHCTLIVGYNKDGFVIRNSWGTSFGNHGYILMPYEDFDNIFEIWTIY